MQNDPQGKIALVTGANRGIGLAITKALLNAGATKVYAAVRKTDSAQALVDAYGERVVPVELDLSKPETVTAAAQAAGDVKIVINNAGVLTETPAISDDAEKNLTYELEVNTFGLLRIANAFAPILKQNGGGALVQLNSVVSIKTFPMIATYSASKAATYALTQALREQLDEQGTQVLSVHPGPIETQMTEGFDLEMDTPDAVANGIVESLRSGAFHLFPDKMSRELWSAYEPFATAVVESEIAHA